MKHYEKLKDEKEKRKILKFAKWSLKGKNLNMK